VTLRTAYDIRGWTDVYSETATANARVFCGYKPLRVWSTAVDNFVDKVQWNDGILTGIFSMFNQYPVESKATDGVGRPRVSNIMTRGRSLYGGGLVGADWKEGYDRWTFNNVEANNDYNAPIHEEPGCVIHDTRYLHYHSYKVHLKETTYCTPAYMGGSKNDFFIDRWKHKFNGFILSSDSTDAECPFSNSEITNISLQNTSIWELRKWLSHATRIKVRNIIIRLPNEDESKHARVDDRWSVGKLAHILKSETNWQAAIWDYIKSDFMLNGDNQYGEPSGYNSDLYARINPRYTVMRDYCTYMGVAPEATMDPLVQHSKFTHNFTTRYPIYHSVGTHDTDFMSTSVTTDDRQKISAGEATPASSTVTGVTWEMDDVEEIAPKIKRQRHAETSNTTAPVTDLSTQMDSEVRTPTSTTEAQPAQGSKPIELTANSADQSPLVLLPNRNRIVWIRIPRLAGSIELEDLINNEKIFIPGTVSNATNANPTQIVLHCLAQMFNTVEGFSQFKFLDPAVMGKGSMTRLTEEGTGNNWGASGLPEI
jgi:hypothetical protein